jgi:hypothetical protein
MKTKRYVRPSICECAEPSVVAEASCANVRESGGQTVSESASDATPATSAPSGRRFMHFARGSLKRPPEYKRSNGTATNHCYGQFNSRVGTRCRSCLIQRLCAQDTPGYRIETGPRTCYGQHPLGMDHPCVHCLFREQCTRETGNYSR